MFKVTPRSVLFGENLLRKSITRVILDEDGNLQHFADNLLPEHMNSGVHNYFGTDYRIDRPPTGEKEKGHYHMIDALYQQLLKLIQRNGYDINTLNQMLGEGNPNFDLIKSILDTYIQYHNEDVMEQEGDNSNKIIPDSQHPDWRRNVVGPYYSKANFKDRLYPTHAAEEFGLNNQTHNHKTGEVNNTLKLITLTNKKDDVQHPDADTSQYVDGATVPFYRQVDVITPRFNAYLKQKLGISPDTAGPLDNYDELLQDYMNPVVPLSAISSGQVHGIKSKDWDEIKSTGRLSSEYAQRVGMYGLNPYQAAPNVAPVHTVGHGNVHYPSQMFVPNAATGRPVSQKGHDREALMLNFLKDISENARLQHMTPQDKEQANQLLQILKQGMTRTVNNQSVQVPISKLLSTSPAISHIFGGQNSKAASLGKKGYGINQKGEPTYLSTVANDLGIDENVIRMIHSAIDSRHAEKFTSGKQSRKIVHNLHALNAALINQLSEQGDPNASATAGQMIRQHGLNDLSPDDQLLANTGHAVVDLFSKYHQLRPGIAEPTEYQRYDSTQLIGNSLESPILSNITVSPPPMGPAEVVAKSILKSFENLQMKSAKNDKTIMKYVQPNLSINSINDVRKYSVDNNLNATDIYGVVSSKGDWNVVAKQWAIPIDIVKGIKLTFGDA